MDIDISINGKQVPAGKKALHMCILHSDASQQSAVTCNIDMARRTIYNLKGYMEIIAWIKMLLSIFYRPM